MTKGMTISKVTYFSGWRPELFIQLTTDNKDNADFNRFLVKHIPTTKQLKQSGNFEDANRADLVLKLKNRFVEVIKEGGSQYSLYKLFHIRMSLRA